jgi:regulator of sigma E protease
MSIFLGILLALLVFLIVVLVHEFGHFITARLTGMRVEEFGFGIPPRVKTLFTDKKGTDFTINALPIGGFVRIYGEDPTGKYTKDSGAFITKKWPMRILVLVA